MQKFFIIGVALWIHAHTFVLIILILGLHNYY